MSSRSGLACRPNLAGWPYAARPPYYLGRATGLGRNEASMLLSFERPAPVGARGYTSNDDVTEIREDRLA